MSVADPRPRESTVTATDSLPTVDEPPMRMVVRQVSEMMIACALRWQEVTGRDRMDGMLVQVVLGANVARAADGLFAADTERRPLSLLSAAQSMGFAYETARRRARVLRDAGWLVGREAGLIVPAAALESIDGRALLAADAITLRATVARLAEAGHAASAAAQARVSGAPDEAVALVLLGFTVRVMERFVALYEGFVPGMVCAAIVAANVRHMTRDVALARRYATPSQPPSDVDRIPVSLRALSREMALPFETVRRHVLALAERGIAERRGGGWIVPTRIVTGPEHERHNALIHAQFERMLAAIVAA